MAHNVHFFRRCTRAQSALYTCVLYRTQQNVRMVLLMFITLLFCPYPDIYAQNTNSPKALINYAEKNKIKDPARALEFTEKAIRLFDLSKDTLNREEAWLLFLDILYTAPGTAISYADKFRAFEKAATHFQKMEDDNHLARIHYEWAIIGQEVDKTIGLEHGLIAQNLFLALRDTQSAVDCLLRMGSLQDNSENTAQAKKHFKSALALADAAADDRLKITTYLRAAEFYFNDKSIGLAQEHLIVSEKWLVQFSPEDLRQYHWLKGKIDLRLGFPAEAKGNLRKALNTSDGRHSADNNAAIYIALAEAYHLQDSLEAALKALFWGKSFAHAAQSDKLLAQAYFQLSEVYKKLEDYKTAFDYKEQYIKAVEAIQSASIRQDLMRMEAQYQNQKNEATIASQQLDINARQAQKNRMISTIVFLVIVAIILIFFNRRISLNRKKLAHQHTLIKKQAEDLQVLDEVKSRFFANISHELRTPLTLILGPIKSILRKEEVNGKVTNNLLLVQKNAQQLLNQVNEILDLSKLDAGRMTLNEKPVAFFHFLTKVVAEFEGLAQQHNNTLHFTYQLKKDKYLWVDADKLHKILRNVLANALRYTHNGAVALSVSESNGSIRIEVSDTGTGIHAEDLPHIFERYYQAKHTKGLVSAGTGIGLTLAKELAQLMNAHLYVESEWTKGSHFFLVLPKKMGIQRTDAQQKKTISEYEAEQNVRSKVHNHTTENGHKKDKHTKGIRPIVYIVEDNDDMRQFLESALTTHFHILPFSNGKEVWKWLSDLSSDSDVFPDLILTDLMMPKMDGWKLFREVKAHPAFHAVPVLILTAKADQQDKLHALRIGVDDYVFKPFDEDELLARMKNLTKNYKKRKNISAPKAVLAENTSDLQKEVAHSVSDNALNREWLQQVEEITQKGISSFAFNVSSLSREMALSTRQFSRRIKELTGLTPGQYIHEVRYATARKMLEEQQFTSVKEVVYAIGLKDTKHFSRQFKARYGKPPSSYL